MDKKFKLTNIAVKKTTLRLFSKNEIKYHCCKCNAELDIESIVKSEHLGRWGWRQCEACDTYQLLGDEDAEDDDT